MAEPTTLSPDQRKKKRQRLTHTLVLIGCLILVGIILWLDIVTGFWQDVVILSGLAAGLVTFILTVFVLDRVMARSTAKRWAPVNRLALTEFLHTIADEKESEISRGIIVPRRLIGPDEEAHRDPVVLAAELDRLRHDVVKERRHLTTALGQWAPFLVSSGDHEEILTHIAEISMRLDGVRDATLELETIGSPEAKHALTEQISLVNATFVSLSTELSARIEQKT